MKDSSKIGGDEEFEQRNKKFINSMNKNKSLLKKSKDWIDNVFDYEYVYHFRWLGRPIIQFPQDMVAVQELIWKIKPDFIIESGIARGGSLIFYASILELLNHGKIIGVDIDIRKHNRIEIENHTLFKRIKLIEGSSIDDSVIHKIKKIIKDKKKIMILLDSHHTEQHVLEELEKYSPFVRSGSYIVVFDTIIAVSYTHLRAHET